MASQCSLQQGQYLRCRIKSWVWRERERMDMKHFLGGGGSIQAPLNDLSYMYQCISTHQASSWVNDSGSVNLSRHSSRVGSLDRLLLSPPLNLAADTASSRKSCIHWEHRESKALMFCKLKCLYEHKNHWFSRPWGQICWLSIQTYDASWHIHVRDIV